MEKDKTVVAFLMMNPFHHKIYRGDYNDGGEYNGYVAFNAELPNSWQGGADWSDDDTPVLDHIVDVHGGITFDRPMSELLDNPIIPLTSIPNPETLKTFRCIGFDTLHCDDTKARWPIDAVKNETLNLMEQIKELIAEKL